MVFHSFPDSANDVPRGVGNMIKWIKERDPKVRFGLIENKSGEAIVGRPQRLHFHPLASRVASMS